MKQAIFIDRDGVINVNKENYVKSWDEFEFLPNVKSSLAKLSDLNRRIFVVTNQSVVGRGIISEQEANQINTFMVIEIRRAGGRIDKVYMCPHAPWENCWCRKPKPGLLYKAADEWGVDLEDSWLIGDAESDMMAALIAGCRPIFVLSGREGRSCAALSFVRKNGIPIVKSLEEAIKFFL